MAINVEDARWRMKRLKEEMRHLDSTKSTVKSLPARFQKETNQHLNLGSAVALIVEALDLEKARIGKQMAKIRHVFPEIKKDERIEG